MDWPMMKKSFPGKDVIVMQNYCNNKIKKIPNYIIKNAINITNFMNSIQPHIKQRIFHILHEIPNIVKCEVCNKNPTTWLTGVKGYRKCCSLICSRKHPDCKKKMQNTLMERYGVLNISQIPEVKQKKKDTTLKHYGVESPLQIRANLKNAMMKKYGVENPSQSSVIKQKKKETLLHNHGVEHNFQLVDKIKKSNLKKYGVENPSQSSVIKQKKQKLSLRKYGVSEPNKKHFSDEYKNIHIDKEKLSLLYKNNSIFTIANTHNVSWTSVYNHLRKHNIPLDEQRRLTSKAELEIGGFLQHCQISIKTSNRVVISPYELDIVIPEKKIAIEYCGLYWHSELRGKDNHYHKNKLDMCNSLGYQLITIFEDEWENKKEICKNRLKHILGINDTTCYARQTIIKEIDSKIHRIFLDKHHIQGHVGAKIKLGAFFNDELVAIMTFGKKRRALGNKIQKNNEYELLRFCTKGNIPGIGSKLFKYFTRTYKPTDIISYCDLRWGTGDFYEKLGFYSSHTSKPNYWYLNNNVNREHRFKYQKQSLVEMASYSIDKTEWQIMQDEGYNRIWDCGNKVFKWILCE